MARWLQGVMILLLVCVLSLVACTKEGPTASDTQAPVAEVTFPLSNTSVSGVVIIMVEAEDNEGVVRVEFYIDEVLQFSDESSPWEFSWETLIYDNGTKHSIVAKAYDRAGNSGSSQEVSVVVNNEINNPPTAIIVLPDDSTSFALGEEVIFMGEGRDALGGVLEGDQLAWYSNRDWRLGTGTYLTRDDLSEGWHTITLVATDDRELEGRDSTYIHISTELEISQITIDPGIDEKPCWSPDGQRIAFHSNRSGNFDIWVVSVLGGGETQVTVDPSSDWDPAWYGSEIAFTSFRSGNADIWKIADTGGDPVQVTDHPGWDGSASWSSDGEHLVISSQMGGEPHHLWILPMGDGEPTELTTEPGYEPDWYIGDIAYQGLDLNIYVTSLTGVPEQKTWDPARDTSPSWSPDGQAIAFTSGRGGNKDIWILSLQEDQLRQLTFYSGDDYDPAWSPNGKWIAFVSDRSGNPDIWIVEVQP